jgi:cell fate (sporulation/competence/biofilm development) regulator YlbF (YheA/YmcA/DUF963 family)
MKVYDEAHRLARELAASKEYKMLIEARKKLKSDSKTQEMVKDFRMKQFELQAAQLTGQEGIEEKEEKLHQLYGVISANTLAREVLEAEHNFNRLYTDIQKIINEAIEDSIDIE